MNKAIGSGSDGGEWAITRFLSEEVFNPKKFGANIGVLYGVSVFAGAVYFIERYGDLLAQ
ncbi:hypothetical protein GGI04_004277 [Coemansia thaxteri]|uniref:Uncharacterized protein n=1 Tax=Coemansia thaxteri TaxID=2663907 RepID=A0A9W8BA35_9FUNG|nr:hypothetical protein H4R26_004941 [Coemansia thaxteri]KAJ2000130.1 hypothetical protein GGI04_004277 [Coemansia thaxteri]KAJ2470396.1 hypothetical protein GGI02_002956 [Coemansia sp. RSA 2322]